MAKSRCACSTARNDRVSDILQPGVSTTAQSRENRRPTTAVWLQLATLAWMLVECGVSLYAALAAHSPALLAFGSDSLVELLSAAVVLLQSSPALSLSERS